MSMTSGPNDLTSRMRQRLEADRRQIEETAARELERLGERLSAVASGALRSIEADTASAIARMSVLLRRAWLRPLVVGLSLFLGYQRRQLGDDALVVEEHRGPDRDVGDAERANRGGALRRWPRSTTTTWGVTLREIDGERFVVLPAGTLEHPPWTVRGRPAVKLSRE